MTKNDREALKTALQGVTKRFHCDFCSEKFPTQKGAARHVQAEHIKLRSSEK